MAVTYIPTGSPSSVEPAPAPAPVTGTPPFPNVLHQFSSYNYILTLSAISTAFCNDSTYRNGISQQDGDLEIICRSGAGLPENRQITDAGKFDFFIDDLKITSAAGMDQMTKNTNATGISFTVTEPYSMGLFYQSLQNAAFKCKHFNFIVAPYLLTIEFTGHISSDKLNVKIPDASKYISMRIFKVEMTTSQAGSKYFIEAFPWNEQGYNSIHTQFTTDVSIKGKTVQELLGSDLTTVVNENLKSFAKTNGDTQPDIISIVFPDSSGTSVSNEISESSMKFDTMRTAFSGMKDEIEVFNPATGTFLRSKMPTNPSVGEFKFGQGSDIINAINQVVLMSEFGKNSLNSVDQNGMVKWWKVTTRYYQVETSDYTKADGTPPCNIVYEVKPYKVHISKFTPPNTKLVGKENLDLQALKEYNYIYTGKNQDILDFQIKIDHGFFNPVSADSTLKTADLKTGAQQSNSATDKVPLAIVPIEPGDPRKTDGPGRIVRQKTQSSLGFGGGGGQDDPASLAAKNFFDAIISPASLVQLDMTILGDPYFLGDSGLGNYTAKDTQYFNMNSDGAVNWQNGEVDVIVNFKTPIDPGPDGMYTFVYDSSGTKTINQFSGLYKVYLLESNFVQGKFTQILTLTRRLSQFTDNPEGEPISKQTTNNQAVSNPIQ